MKGFQPGDLVRLKSGGPLMTVESVQDVSAQCAWFCRASEGSWGEVGTGWFRFVALELSEDEL